MSGDTLLFLYGTLRDPDLLAIVAGRPIAAEPAWIAGFLPRLEEGQRFPAMRRARRDDVIDGALVKVDAAAMERIAFYKVGFRLQTIAVETGAGAVEARFFGRKTDINVPGPVWDFEGWRAEFADRDLEMATEFMRLFGRQSADEANGQWGQIELRAAMRLRAAATPSPDATGRDMRAADVTLTDTRQPYSDFFAVREDDLSFPQFDGGQSATVKRASFIGTDAVTVLPWDPLTDNVLLIRQFRHGAFCRGDPNPWTLEPVAGRIDLGEMPEDTARRELAEETGLAADGPIFPIASYYPTAGAYSEYLYGFVIVTDLSEADGRLAGMAGEAEDILSCVFPLEDALVLIESGAANTGPLILSLQWLALNKERLRGTH